MAEPQGLDIAYLHYGVQSQVTPGVSLALSHRGHRMTPLHVPGPLEPRNEDGRRHVSFHFALNLAVGALRFGRLVYGHRWNTPFAFDVHTRRAEQLLAALPSTPDLILQNGALFSPGVAHLDRTVLLLDHTRQLSMERPAQPEADLPAPIDYGPGWHARERALYQGVGAIATFSHRVAHSLRHDYGVAREKIHVVGGGANVHPEKVERRDDGQTLLFVGKDFRRKGGPVLLRAFEQLRRRRPATRLLIAGPCESLALPGGATCVGRVPPQRLPELFSTATVFVLPTLREPFGLAFLDAMACGVPCIGTRVEAVPEVIEEGRSGLLVEPGDERGLADAMESLLDDPARAHGMGLRGRLRVDAGYLWSHVAERLDRAFLAVAKPRALPLADERHVA